MVTPWGWVEGKTPEHIAEVFSWLDTDKVDPQDFSVLVLTLKAAIPQWELWISRICPELREHFTVTNHEQLLERYRETCANCKGEGSVKSFAFGEPSKCVECKGKGWRPKTRPNHALKKHWTFVIVDESHKFKNRKAAQTKALKTLTTKTTDYKREATGTPVINHPADLWSQLNYLDPKRWSSYWRFFEEFVDYYVDYKTVNGKLQGFKVIVGPKNEDKLRKELEGIFINRKKKSCTCPYGTTCSMCDGTGDSGYASILGRGTCAQCQGAGKFRIGLPHDHLDDLPDMPEPVIRYVDLEGVQKRAYKAMQKDALAWVGEHEDQPLAAPVVIAQLRRLQMLADAYMGSDEAIAPKEIEGVLLAVRTESPVRMMLPSAKLEALYDIIEGTDEPIVVFSQFRQMIVLAADYLAKKGTAGVLVMHGQSPDKDKGTLWRSFQEGLGRVFLTTIGAGGTGIDLYRASVCVFLDRSWSPAQNEQAEGRLYRAGQKNSVQRFYIEARDTVDQKVGEKLAWKADIVRKIFGG
jgi:SNF2 family DNA or RNA helicase